MSFRKDRLSRPIYHWAKSVLPEMSATEAEAIEAGDVWWDAELFTGAPDWEAFLDIPPAELTEAEQAFIDGPVERLCAMLDDWKITWEDQDLPPEVWAFLKRERFFGMIIPKRYGGLEFSAYAHSEVVRKISTRSTAAAVTVMVPNSLGPGELLMQFGTDAQRDHWLPRLADGREIPAFGLTSPEAGSDAASMTDEGVICEGQYQGRKVLGMRLNWRKRYITLGPISTVLGLAFKLRDPDGLLGGEEDLGITVALVPTDTPGVTIGRRHLPSMQAFINGPNEGHDVFLPLDAVLGGRERIGQGWMMLNAALAAGRGISLPSLSSAGAALAARTTGAYARVRQQFRIPIGEFEGVQERLARIAANAYLLDAARRFTCSGLALGHHPSVVSAIMKHGATERMRVAANDAMDVHAGKAVIDGPSNYAGNFYRAVPVGITVEGANILTRSLLIFGQGAILCHPWVMKEMKAAQEPDRAAALDSFDESLSGHVRYGISNAFRSFWFGITGSKLGGAPGDDYTRPFFRKLDRYAANLALMADVSMLLLGGKLKFKESLSGRLGDVLSHLYMAGAVLKRHHDEGAPEADKPLLAWSMYNSFHVIETALSDALRNFPIRPVGWALWALVFPLGRRAEAPGDRLNHRVASLLMAPNEARDRLGVGVFLTPCPNNPGGRIDSYLAKAVQAEPVERKFLKALKTKGIEALEFPAQLDEAVAEGVITAEERKLLEELRALTLETITVDDFDAHELRAASYYDQPRPGAREAA